MKTPTWAIVIGICLMLFGSCGVIKNTQSINMPTMIEMQQHMIQKMEGSTTSDNSDGLSEPSNVDTTKSQNNDMFNNMAERMQGMFAMSEFTKTWMVRFGYIGLFLSIIYILSGVFLLIKRKFSIKLVYIALITSIVFSVIQSLVLTSDPSGGFFAKSAGFTNILGIIIDIILFMVVVSMDKSAYNTNTEELV